MVRMTGILTLQGAWVWSPAWKRRIQRSIRAVCIAAADRRSLCAAAALIPQIAATEHRTPAW